MYYTNKIEPWKVNNIRFLGFMDIMGFKDMISRKPHKEIEYLLYEMIRFNKALEHIFGKPSLRTKETRHMDPRIRTITFSDSILFISQDDSIDDFLRMSEALSVFQEASLQRCAPTKGAISVGMLTADFKNSMFFGQVLIDAYLLQDQLKYYGIIADNTIEEYIINKNKESKEIESNIDSYFKRLKTPLKSGIVTHYNLRLGNPSKPELFNLYKNVSGEPRKYVDNTIEMFDLMNP